MSGDEVLKSVFTTLLPVCFPAGEVEGEGPIRSRMPYTRTPRNLVLRASVHYQGYGGLAQDGQEGWNQISLERSCGVTKENVLFFPLSLITRGWVVRRIEVNWMKCI